MYGDGIRSLRWNTMCEIEARSSRWNSIYDIEFMIK